MNRDKFQYSTVTFWGSSYHPFWEGSSSVVLVPPILLEAERPLKICVS